MTTSTRKVSDTHLPTPTLHTERLTLRPITTDDVGALWRMQSDAYVLRYWDEPPWTDPAQAERFLARCRSIEDSGTGARVALELTADSTFLGWCNLSNYDADFRTATMGYCLLQEAWGHGYATEAARELLRWAFDHFDLNRVQSEADTRNIASRRVLEKLGFVLEGTLREDVTVNGVTSDSWVFGLLRREWQG